MRTRQLTVEEYLILEHLADECLSNIEIPIALTRFNDQSCCSNFTIFYLEDPSLKLRHPNDPVLEMYKSKFNSTGNIIQLPGNKFRINHHDLENYPHEIMFMELDQMIEDQGIESLLIEEIIYINNDFIDLIDIIKRLDMLPYTIDESIEINFLLLVKYLYIAYGIKRVPDILLNYDIKSETIKQWEEVNFEDEMILRIINSSSEDIDQILKEIKNTYVVYPYQEMYDHILRLRQSLV